MGKRKITRMAVCHPDRVHNCKDLCASCYRKKLYRENGPLRARTRAASKAWRIANIERSKAMDKNKHLQRKFGINSVIYDLMLKKQDYRCLLCGCSERINSRGYPNKPMSLSVDHCHKTKRVRGLLCFKCNTSISVFERHPGLLDRVKQYLS